MNIVIIVIASIAFFIFYIILISFLSQLIAYFDKKTQLKLNESEINAINKDKLLSYTEKVTATLSQLEIISFLIDNEIIRLLDRNARIQKAYNSTMLDEDSKKIAEKVYNGLKKDINFSNPNILITDEYIMSYITEHTISSLINKSFEYNTKLLELSPSESMTS